jgi:hypothetical protein
MSTTTSHGTASEKKQADERRRTRKTGTTPKPTPTTGTRQPPQQPPDGASRKGSDVGTPPPPEQGIGLSPRAEGLVVGGGTSTKPRRRERRLGRRLRRGHRRPGVSPGPKHPTTIHPAKSRRSSRWTRETPVREGDLPGSDAEAGGGLSAPPPHARRHPAAHTAGDAGQHSRPTLAAEPTPSTTRGRLPGVRSPPHEMARREPRRHLHQRRAGLPDGRFRRRRGRREGGGGVWRRARVFPRVASEGATRGTEEFAPEFYWFHICGR